MLVGIGKSCWYRQMNYLVMVLWKSRSIESNLGKVSSALSCVEHDHNVSFSQLLSLETALACFSSIPSPYPWPSTFKNVLFTL